MMTIIDVLFFLASNGLVIFFFFSSRGRHTRSLRDWSSDVCSSDLTGARQRHVARRYRACDVDAALGIGALVKHGHGVAAGGGEGGAAVAGEDRSCDRHLHDLSGAGRSRLGSQAEDAE